MNAHPLSAAVARFFAFLLLTVSSFGQCPSRGDFDTIGVLPPLPENDSVLYVAFALTGELPEEPFAISSPPESLLDWWEAQKALPFPTPPLALDRHDPQLEWVPNAPILGADNPLLLADLEDFDNLPASLPGLNEAGNTIIKGEVYDFATSRPLAGAVISIAGRQENETTDAQGKFRISGLPAGTYRVTAVTVGYATANQLVTTSASTVAEAAFGLRVRASEGPSEFELEEESIIVDYEEEAGGDFSLDLNADTSLVSGIDASQFSEQGISDAGDAVSQIAGANIVGGKFAVVRGLGDRYSNTLFNGSLISSADPSRKAVQLDLFPSELLQSVEIQKNYSPDRTAEWAGGLVRIDTAGIPEERLLKVKVGTGTDDFLRDADPFFVVPGADFGLLNGPSGATLDNAFGLAFASQTRLARENALNSSFGLRPERSRAEDEFDIGIIFGDAYELAPNVRLGVNLSFNRERQDSARLNEIVNRDFDPITETFRFTSQRNTYEQNLNWGFLGAFALELGERHTLRFNHFRFSDSTTEASLVRDIREEQIINGELVRFRDFISSNPGSAGSGSFFFGDAGFLTQSEDSLQSFERDLSVTQFGGTHLFGKDPDKGVSFNWSYARSTAKELRPQDTSLEFTSIDFSDPSIQGRTFRRFAGFIPGTFIPLFQTENESFDPDRAPVDTLGRTDGDGNNLRYGTRESLSTIENTNALDGSLTIPLFTQEDSDNGLEITLGAASLTKQRQTRGELFGLFGTAQFNDDVLVSENNSQTGAEFLEGINDGRTASGRRIFGNSPITTDPNNALFYERLTNNPATRRNIDAGTKIDAYFLQGKLKQDDWTILGGFRVERETRSFEIVAPGILNFQAPGSTEPTSGSETNTHVAPALTITKTLGTEDEHTVVASWSETIARPTFFEFAPVFTEDQATGDLRAGNQNLRDSTISNFDLGWIYKHRATGNMFGVNLFRKEISDTIVNSFLNQGTDNGRAIQTYINAEDGLLQGIELEGLVQLNDHWNLSSNYTFIDSQLSVPFGTSGSADVGFQGQPEHIANVSLGYANEDWGFNANLVYNYTGEFLSIVPASAVDDRVVQEARQTLNLILQKEISLLGQSGRISFRVENLLDEPVRQINRPSGRIRQSFNPGQSYSLSFSTEF